MTRQPPFTFPKINIPALELGSVAQGKLRTLQRAGWVISGYALQQHTDALWPMRSALVTDGYFGMLPDENQPEAAAAETCEISQTAKLRNAMRLLHEVSAEFFVDGHDLEYEDGDHPLVDRVRAFLAGAPTPEADGYPPLPRGTDAGACMSDAEVFTASEMRAYVDADRAMRECGVRSALQTIHDTFKADLSAGYITRDKEFAVSIAHEALSAAPAAALVALPELRGFLSAVAEGSMSRNNQEQLATELLCQLDKDPAMAGVSAPAAPGEARTDDIQWTPAEMAELHARARNSRPLQLNLMPMPKI